MAFPGARKPGVVAHEVEQQLGIRFGTNDHTRCWKQFHVRPPTGATDKANTDIRYCHYDEPHDDYVYTDKWVEFLVLKLSKPETYREVLGREPEMAAKLAVLTAT